MSEEVKTAVLIRYRPVGRKHARLRYSGFITGLDLLARDLGLGEPCSMYVHAGAIGLVTIGIHFIDLACEPFGLGPDSVVSIKIGVKR